MSSQNLVGNGSRLSLENCFTNIFALTDLAGIRWKRLRSQGSNMDVLDDPVLTSYAKCLKADMLCSWARVPITDGSAPPSNFMDYAKELWVFWYGDEPTHLETNLSPDLKESESGSWETTLLSYECRTFLFKALHNVIERCLMAKQFVRIGKWFVMPHSETGSDLYSPLSFSFQNFFLHGDSTVCVSVDVEKREPIYRLTSQQLKLASTVNAGQTAGGSSNASSPVQVILAPYGLSGVLTGRTVSPADQSLTDWQQFYPLSYPYSSDNDLPQMVEVAVGGVRMKYPCAFILTTSSEKSEEEKVKPEDLERSEKSLGDLVTRTSNENVQIVSGRKDEDASSWCFNEAACRSGCNCVKGKTIKVKHQKGSSPISPKTETKRSRTPFHRRSPPLEKLITSGKQSVLPTIPASQSQTANQQVSSSASTVTSVSTPGQPLAGASTSADPVPSIGTPQMNLKDALSSPAAFPQPSPLRAPGSVKGLDKQPGSQKPPSVLQASSIDEKPLPNIQQPGSVKNQSAPRSHPPLMTSMSHEEVFVSAQNPEQISLSASSSLLASPYKDPTKRPLLPGTPDSDDELTTDSLYGYSGLNAWLDHPLKRFKGQYPSDVKPQGYEKLSHPLLDGSMIVPKAEAADTQVLNASLSSVGPRSNDPMMVPLVKTETTTETVGASLMTSDSLKPHMSDLDKMFDSEDEDERAATSSSSMHLMNGHGGPGHQQTLAPSGGMSMASAQAVGPISATDLSQIYPTPPSHDNHHTALSPVDIMHHPGHDNLTISSQADHEQETQTLIYKSANIAKYVNVDEYQPIDLPSGQQPINIPASCHYDPWATVSKPVQMPLSAVENLPSTLSMHQPSSVRSARSPHIYPAGRTPGGPLDILSPGSVTSVPPKSVPGLLSVEPPSTHGTASTFNAQSLPEAQSLLVIMTLSDSMLNLYKDQNFESCNLCVCNMNILGNDSGLYLPREKYEAQYKCSCGFSAVVNRKYGFCTGLFYQDECDIMNHRDDRFDKLKISPLAEKGSQEVNKVILNHLKEQFGTWYLSIMTRYSEFPQNIVSGYDKKTLIERQDITAVIMSALKSGQYMQDAMVLHRHRSQLQCVSKWSLDKTARHLLSSTEIIQLLKSLQPALQDAVQKKRTTSIWDPNAIKVTGPLTWQAFFKLSGRNDGLLEPQPIPPMIAGNDDDWMKLSLYAIQHWDKLMLKPYGGERNVSYIVLAPDNEFINKVCKKFFFDLSQVYEACHLGKHSPLPAFPDGILRIGKKLSSEVNDKSTSDWFNKIDSQPFAQKIKMIAKVFKYYLAPKLAPSSADSSNTSSSHDNVFTKPNQPGTPSGGLFSPPPRDETSNHGVTDILNDTRYKDAKPKSRDSTHSNNVIYLINPFSNGATDHMKKGSAESDDSLSTLALFMCYQELLDAVPESVRNQTYLHIIPLHALVSTTSTHLDTQVLKSMAFSVYSRTMKKYTYQSLGHSMTGFGPVAESDKVQPISTYTSLPPYILAPACDHPSNDISKPPDSSRVLFCAYCLSEDQRYLLASVITDNGEILDSTVINIHIPNMSKRKKATVIGHGIHRLFEYLVQTMSKGLFKWRLVIGRFGRLGHSELEEWSKVLSKRSLQRACNKLKESCTTCSTSSVPADRQIGISGACLTSIEPHASFSLLFNDMGSKEDKKSSSTALSTPQDASVTHILVIPNSTTAGGSHSQNEAPIDFSSELGGDSNNLLGIDMMGDDLDLGDVFALVSGSGFETMGASPPHSPRGSPTNNFFTQTSGIGSRRGTSVMESSEELVNQQPLAMGYMVSTAPTGRLPAWFYSAAPQSENSCPIVLKSALHFRTVCSQQPQDDYGQTGPSNNSANKNNAHPLDSNQTSDVLRFVLDSYNRLSWLTFDPATNDRRSCLPVHIDVLMKFYEAINSFL